MNEMFDLTFLIHYYNDCPERLRNIVAVARWLSRQQILTYIWSDSPNPFGSVKNEPTYIRVLNSESMREKDLMKEINGHKYHHRTKAINILARHANTKYIAIGDADIICDPQQLRDSMSLLQSGYDFAYPADGRFYRMHEEPSSQFAESLDENDLINSRKYDKSIVSFGGLVLANREKYLEIGGENQNFVCYGPEDYDRYYRMSQLGETVRIPGILYHLYHPRTEQSGTDNPFFQSNVEEYRKVSSMNRNELREYISTWPWVKEFNQ